MRIDKVLELIGKQGEKTDSFFNYIAKGSSGGAGDNMQGHYMSLKEIAKEFGVTIERVRQIEQRALKKLHHPKRSTLLKPFLQD